MKNNTITPIIPMSSWQFTLSAIDCATTPAPSTPNAVFAPFAAADAVATDVNAVKRERALTGKGHRGLNTVYVSGFLAWSPPI